MNAARAALSTVGLALLATLAFSSCQNSTLMKLKPLEEGEMKLVRMMAPVTMREGEPTDILVDFRALGEPAVKNVCFRWSSALPATGLPSLYYYGSEMTSQANAPAEITASGQDTQSGEFAVVSPYVCVAPKGIEYDLNEQGAGSLTATFTPSDLSVSNKYLECYVEYTNDSGVKETNRIFVPIDASR